MRYLRQSFYGLGKGVATTVCSETDLKVDIHVAANLLRTENSAGVDTDIEIFECDGDLETATRLANELAQKRVSKKKRRYDTFYDWVIAMLDRVQPDGSIGTKSDQPLSVEEIRKAFMAVVKHPLYKGQTVVALSIDHLPVMIQKGQVS